MPAIRHGGDVLVRVKDGTRYGTHNQFPAGTLLLVEEATLRSVPQKLERVEPPTEDEETAPLAPLKDIVAPQQYRALLEAGYGHPSTIMAATDDELLAIPNVGPGTLNTLRSAYGQS